MHFVWHQKSPLPNDAGPRSSGMETSLLEAFDSSNKKLGHVKASYTTSQLIEDVLPSPLYYKQATQGWCLNTRLETEDDVAKLWADFHRMARVSPPSYQGQITALSPEHAPDVATCHSDIKQLEATFDIEYQTWKKFFAVPFVAYAYVEEAARRQGVARAMYRETACRLAQSNLVLRASGMQSESAAALWESFQNNPSMPTSTVTLRNPPNGPEKCYPTLDYINVSRPVSASALRRSLAEIRALTNKAVSS